MRYQVPVTFTANTGVTYQSRVREHDVTARRWMTRSGVHVCVQRAVENTDFSLVGLQKCQVDLVDGSKSNSNPQGPISERCQVSHIDSGQS